VGEEPNKRKKSGGRVPGGGGQKKGKNQRRQNKTGRTKISEEGWQVLGGKRKKTRPMRKKLGVEEKASVKKQTAKGPNRG